MSKASFAERALARIEQLEARLMELERSQAEPIAIIGMACRLPGADGPSRYWELLRAGTDAICDIPASRWDNDAHYDPDPKAPGKIGTRWGGLIEAPDAFDRELFDISPREAMRMDPQQRILLEVVWRAFEDAGLPVESLRGAPVASYIGMCGSDYSRMQHRHVELIDAYTSTGSALSIASARLAYQWDLRGPNLVVDTACSSSLSALHLGVTALRRNECSIALAGGVHLMLTPDSIVSFTKWGMLSPDGRCKTFDARANGIVMGEGCGVVVLKRLADAERDGDRILALVHGSALNQDGRSLGVTAPNVEAQREVIRAALRDAALKPEQIGYIEAHGTGTSLGDPIEMEAIGDVYGRSGRTPLWVGSAKTNIGHLEAAAGVAGLIKLIMVLQHEEIPPNLHYETLNPRIDLGDSLHVPERIEPFRGQQRYAGISSFGFGGTNAHAIIGTAPSVPPPEREATSAPHVLPLTVCRPETLAEVAAGYHVRLEHEHVDDVCWSAAVRSSHHRHRVALTGDAAVLRVQLNELASGRGQQKLIDRGQGAPRIAFVFSGHGAQWVGMGRALCQQEPVFAERLNQIATVLHQQVSWQLDEALASESMLERVEVIQPALFAVQVALAGWLEHCGIEPAAVIGHSMGEVAAAHIAGALSLEDAVAIIVARSKLLAEVRGQGGMLMIAANAETAQPWLRRHPELSIGATNSPSSLVLAGPNEAIERLLPELDAEGIRHWRVKTDVPFHSPLVDPLAPRLVPLLAIHPQPPAIPFISTVTGAAQTEALDASYWARNLRDPVRFWPGLMRLLEEGVDVLVEVAAHPVLSTAMTQGIDTRNEDAAVIATARRGHGAEQLRAAIGELWARGCAVRWQALLSQGQTLPSIPQPFVRARYWLEVDEEAQHAAVGGHPLLGQHTSLAAQAGGQLWQRTINAQGPRWLADHQLGQDVVMPAAAVLEMMLSAAVQSGRRAAVTAVRLDQLAPIGECGAELQLSLDDSGALQLFFRDVVPAGPSPSWQRQARAQLATSEIASKPLTIPAQAELAKRCHKAIDMSERYALLAQHGVQLGEAFRAIDTGHVGEEQAWSTLRADELARDTRYALHPCLIDGAMQTLALALPQGGADGSGMHVPVGVERVELLRGADTELSLPLHAWARIDRCDATGARGDVTVIDANGQPVLDISGLVTQRVTRDQGFQLLRWVAHPLPTSPAAEPQRSWCVLTRESSVANTTEQAIDSIDIVIDRALQQAGSHSRRVSRQELLRLLTSDEAIDAVVYPARARDADSALAECTALKALAIALAKQPQPPQLVVLTQGAQGDSASVRNPHQACHWGLLRSLVHEHPELRCSLLDSPSDAPHLGRALTVLPGHAQWLLRGESYLSPQLDSVTLLAQDGSSELRADRSYLVSGAFGGIGQALVKWLAARGAGELLLVSRRGEAHPDAAALRDVLAATDTRVQMVAADIAHTAEVTRALEQVSLPLAGVFHLAGALADAPLRTMSDEQLRLAMSPKLHGTTALWEASRDAELDMFVCFSSLAGLLGSPGQANYAAGNAFMDAWAQHHRRDGNRTLSIAWGGWADAGMAVQSGVIERLAQRGLGAFSQQQGLAALDRLLSQPPSAQLAYAPLDKQRVAAALPATAQSGMLAVAATHTSSDIREQLETARPAARPRILLRRLAELLSHVIALDAEHIVESTELARFSFDSMTALELRNALSASMAVKIPVTLVWTLRTVGDVRDFLLEQLGYAAQTPAGEPIAEEPGRELAPHTSTEAQASEDELANLLTELDSLSDAAARDELLEAE